MIRKALALLLVLSIALLANTGCSSDDGSSDSDFTFAIITDVHADAAHAAAMGQLVSRLNEESPDFVVNLGDLIFEGNTATSAQAQEWFDVYQNALSGLDSSIPIYHAVGCHDVVGIGSDNLQNTDFGYGKDLFLSEGWGKEGRTYYSFDHKGVSLHRPGPQRPGKRRSGLPATRGAAAVAGGGPGGSGGGRPAPGLLQRADGDLDQSHRLHQTSSRAVTPRSSAATCTTT